MKLCVLGSGSRGNAIYIEHRNSAILIDQGFSHKELEKRLALRNLDSASIKAIFLTHEHEDHIHGAGITARKLKIPVYGTAGTLGGRKKIFNGSEECVAIDSGDSITFGPFQILPFQVSHDASEPVQYCISSGKKKISVATDLGFVSTLVEQCLKGSHIIVIESNHDVEMLKKGPYPWELKQRVMSRVGHLSNKNAAELLFNLSGNGEEAVILAHLSEENNTPEIAEKTMRELFEKFDRRLDNLIVASQYEPTEIITI